jgi:carboxypeptidase Q
MSRRLTLAVAAAIAAPLLASSSAAPLGAQTNVSDPVLRHIWALGMDSSHTWDLSQVLFDSIGPRLTGTPAGNNASEWVMKMYRSWGIDAKREQYGTWRGWKRGPSHVDMMKPFVRSLEAVTEGYSPGTGGKDLVATTVILPMVSDSDAFVKWLPKAKGKLVLISAAYPTCRPEEEWAAMATPESKARMDTTIVKMLSDWNTRIRNTGYPVSAGNPTGNLGLRLEQAGAAGVIVSNFASPTAEAWGTFTVYDTKNKKTPAIAMSCEDYGLLYRLTEKNQHPEVRVNAVGQTLGEVPVYDTFGTIRGTEKPNEYVLLSAHFDSWDGSQGATDNGTGTITMMEAMRILKLAYPHPKRTIVVGHWPGEEQGLNGSRAWAYDHPEIVRAIQAGFNQDNGTGRIQSTSGVGLPNAAEHMQQWLSKLPQEFQQQIRFTGVGAPATGGTDNASFDCYGAPVFGLSSLNWDYGSYTHHTNRDSFDKIVFDDLKGNATIVAMLAYLASEDPKFITRERADIAASGGRGGGRGAPTGRGAINLGGNAAGRGAAGRGNTDDKGWGVTCPRTPRFTNDTAHVTAPSIRPR